MPSVLANLLVNVGVDTRDMSRGMDRASRDLYRFSRQIEDVSKTMIAGFTLPVVGAAVLATKAFGNFDAALTQSLAIMGDVSDAMRTKLARGAREVATSTKFSAVQAAQSYFYLASAGLDATQSLAALPKVAAFAQAGMFDMATATDLLTDAQSALGLTVRDDTIQNIQNMVRVSDVLVKANTLANASVEQFSTSLTTKAGAALRITNKDIEEGVAVLAAFADQGVKGSDAGTALNIVLRDLQTKAINNADAFKRQGVAVFDSAGEMRHMADIIGDIEKALSGMSTEQKKTTLLQLGFTDKSVIFIQTLLGMSDEIRNYDAALRAAADTTQSVSDKQLETFNAQMGLLKDAVKDAAIEIGAVLAPEIQALAEQITTDLVPAVKDAGEAFAELPRDVRRTMLGIVAALVALPIAGLIGAKLVQGFLNVGKVIKGIGVIGAAAGTALAAGLLPSLIRLAPALYAAGVAAAAFTGALTLTAIVAAAYAIARLTESLWNLRKAQQDLKQTTDTGDKALARLEAHLEKTGFNVQALKEEWLKGNVAGKSWHEVINKAGREHAALMKTAEGLIPKVEKLTTSIEDNERAQLDAAKAAARLAQAYRDLQIDPGRIAELTESLRLVTEQFKQGKLSTDEWIVGLQNVSAAIKAAQDLTKRQVEPIWGGETGMIPAPTELGMEYPTEQEITNLDRVIQELGQTSRDTFSQMLADNEALRRSLQLAGLQWADLGEQITFIDAEQAAINLGITTRTSLEQMVNDAESAYYRIKQSAEHGANAELQAYAIFIQRRLALNRYLVQQEIGGARQVLEARIAADEAWERKNREAINRIIGDQRRATDTAGRFWRNFGNQVSTILTDLGRNVVDIIWPRTTPTVRDVAGITDLGIRAGVSGEQLDELATAVENLALATGQSFSTIASGAAEVFQAFDVGAAQQIPLLESLFDISVTTGAGIDDLFRSLAGGAGIFRALGIEVDDAAALIAKLGQEGEDADEIFRVLQRALDELTARGFSKPAEELQEIIDRIENAGTTAEANALSIRYFGDAGVMMARLIRAGALEVDGLAESMADAANDIEAAAEAVEKLNREANEISKVKRLFEELGRAIVRALAEQGVAAIIGLIAKLKNLKSDATGIVGVFQDIARAIGNIGSALDTSGLGQAAGTAQQVGGVVGSGAGAGTGGGETGGGGGISSFTGNPFLDAFKLGWDIVMDIGKVDLMRKTEWNTRWTGKWTSEWMQLKFAPMTTSAGVTAINMVTAASDLFKIQANIQWLTQEFQGYATWRVNVLSVLSRNLLSAATGSPQLAYAGVPALPAAAQSIRVGDTINISIDGTKIADDDLALDVFKAASRLYRARGVRHRRGLRE